MQIYYVASPDGGGNLFTMPFLWIKCLSFLQTLALPYKCSCSSRQVKRAVLLNAQKTALAVHHSILQCRASFNESLHCGRKQLLTTEVHLYRLDCCTVVTLLSSSTLSNIAIDIVAVSREHYF